METEKQATALGGGAGEQKVFGVILAQAKREVMEVQCRAWGVELPKGGASLTTLISHVYGYLTRHPPTDLGTLSYCGTCRGISSTDLDACPYCGDSNALEEDPTAAELAPFRAPAQGGAPVAADSQAKAVKGKKAEKAEAHMHTEMVKNGTAKAHAAEIVASEKDLNTAVKEAVKLKGDTAGSYWRFGHHVLTQLFQNDLWKQRLLDNGKPKYRHFDQFCHQELGMVPKQVYKMMDTAKYFTEKQLVEWGKSKIGLLLEAPEAERERIAEQNKGKSAAELRGAVRQANREARERGEEPKDRRGRKNVGTNLPKKKPAKAAEAKTITVAAIMGKHRIKLWHKDTLKLEEKDRKPAKRLGDVPAGVFELPNGVKMYLTVRDPGSGHLVAELDFRREE